MEARAARDVLAEMSAALSPSEANGCPVVQVAKNRVMGIGSRTEFRHLDQRMEDKIISTNVIQQIFVGLLRDGYLIRSWARGESMSPFIRKGDFLTVKPITFAEAKIGDILAYRRDETENVLTTHRVIQKGRDGEGPYIITKGDRNRFRDLPISCATHVYGRVVSVERNGRLISLETHLHRVLGYLIALLSLGIWHLRNAMTAPHLVPVKVMRRILRLTR